jgi:heme-degrading monooxygenase HmoA
MWRGCARPETAERYIRHVTNSVFPKLGSIPGNRGAFLLQHPVEGEIEFVVLTLWDSMKSVQKFAGNDSEKAVVEPEARSVLSSFDDFVKHYDVVYETVKS